MKMEKFVCSKCGQDTVAKDAFATWDFETQQFELHSTYDNTKCLNDECEADDSGEWVDVEVTFMLRWTTNGGAVSDGDERFDTREEAVQAKLSLLLDGDELQGIAWATVTEKNRNLIKDVQILELHDGILDPK